MDLVQETILEEVIIILKRNGFQIKEGKRTVIATKDDSRFVIKPNKGIVYANGRALKMAQFVIDNEVL